MSGKPDSLKSILYALFANLSIAVAKGFAAALWGCMQAVNRVERDFRQAFPVVAWPFFEPDNVDGEAS